MAFKIFKSYLLVSFFILGYSIYLWKSGKPNLYLSHFYFGTQFVLLSFFYRVLFVNRLQKILVNIIMVLVLGTLIVKYIIEPNLFYKFNTFEIFACSFPLVVYSIIHLYNSLTRKGVFMFINAGILLYLSISTLIFILGNFIASIDKTLAQNIWFFNKVLYIIYLLFFLVEWYKNIRIRKRISTVK